MRKVLCTVLVSAAFVGALARSSSAQSGWTWRGDIFASSFAPRWYSSYYLDAGDYQYFGGRMTWDKVRADNIRLIYVPKGFRYTHDITDLNNNLGYSGWYATNFPDPKFDTDNDQAWEPWIYEETEVTARSASFPEPNKEYYFMVGMKRGGSSPFKVVGGGTVAHTPAISAKFWWSSEWQTMDYVRRPFLQAYPWKVANPQRIGFTLQESDAQPPARAALKYTRFSRPLSLRKFAELSTKQNEPVASFQLQYEVKTKGGRDILTIQGVPYGGQLIPLERVRQLLEALPLKGGKPRLLGVMAFEQSGSPVRGASDVAAAS